MNVVGDDQQSLVMHQGTRHFLGRRPDVDEERAVVGNEGCGALADHLLFDGRKLPARFVSDVFNPRGQHCAAMGARQQSSVTKFVQILADGLRGDVEALRQIIDLDGARGPRKGKNLVLARAQLGHLGGSKNSLHFSFFIFFHIKQYCNAIFSNAMHNAFGNISIDVHFFSFDIAARLQQRRQNFLWEENL